MDRAMQLACLLESIKLKVSGLKKIYIIWRATSHEHLLSYLEIIAQHQDSNILFFCQENISCFKSMVVSCVSKIDTDMMFFLVDDNIFINDVDLYNIKFDCDKYIFSLRLGKSLSACYTMNCKQELPSFVLHNDWLQWEWKLGKCDWGYPLSVDGHIFSTKEILSLISNINFTAPNQLESEMQRCLKDFINRKGLCFEYPKLLNLPINKVQTVNNNYHGEIHQDYLLEMWQKGYKIDNQKIYGIKPISAHQEIELFFIKRGYNDRN